MLPAPGTLQRIVTSEVARATASLFDKVAAQLPTPLREAIDLLLEMPEGDARSSLFRLKDSPGAQRPPPSKATSCVCV